MATIEFPDDENGDVLRRMAESGIDLKSPRIVDFEHCFPSEAAARAFGESVKGSVSEVRFYEPDPEEDEGSWEVQCRQRLVPSHQAITETEVRLGNLARAHGGFPDGWGSLSNPDGTPAE